MVQSLAGVAAFLILQAVLLGLWNRAEVRPPSWDQSIHLEITLDYDRALSDWDFKGMFLLRPKPGMPPFPPLYHLSMLYAMDEKDPVAAARWINLLYLAVLCVSVWGLGRHFFGDWAGLGAAILIGGMPEVQWLFRDHLPDLALAAWVAAAYWALVASRSFESSRASVAFGALFAVAMLTKWSAFSYFAPVLWPAFQAARDPKRRWNLVACFLVAAGLMAPWYLVQWPVVLPRLVDASADNAVAFWRGGALFVYLAQMVEGMETPFFLIALVSLVAPSVHKQGRKTWILVAWFVLAYAFWAVVPNRQLRYLLPGLVPLAILVMGPWPKQLVIGLCALQLAAAVNFQAGWIPHQRFRLMFPVSLFRTQTPEKADWRIGEILKGAAELHDDGMPFGNLTLMANHTYFNGPNFNWEVDRLGIETIRLRGLNKRICELSEFFLLKTDSLGPRGVTNQLPKVREEILTPGSWFLRGYREVRRWDLPDGSEAVLYKRRKPEKPPFPKSKLVFEEYKQKKFTAWNLVIDFGSWDKDKGVYPKVVLGADRLELRGLRIEKPKLILEDVDLVPVDPPGKDGELSGSLDVRLLRMSALSLVSGTVTEEDAARFLKARAKGTSMAVFKLDGTASADAVIRGIPLTAEVALTLSEKKDALTIEVKRLSAGGLPIPVFIFGPHVRYRLDFAPDPELPFHLRIPALTVEGGRLKLGE